MQKKRPKILFILHTPPPVHGSSMVGKYIRDSEVINGAFDCRFINLGTSGSINQIGKADINKVLRYFSILRKMIWKLLFFRPELCYFAITAHGIGFYKDAILALIIRLLGVKLVYHFHNKGIKNKQDKKVDHILYRLVFRSSYAILLSRHLYPDVEKYFNKNSTFFCPNGIPTNKKHELRSMEGKESNHPPTILFLSNLIESKGVFDLLRACQLLKSIGIDFRCLFIGGTADIDEYSFRAKVNELGLQGQVTYAGRKIGEEKDHSFMNADIFAFPTYYHNECFPLVLLEAMQYSLPVISTIEGGIRDIVESEKTGYLVQQRDTKGLVKHLEYLLQNPDLRKQMGQAGRKRYEEQFTLEKFEQNLKQILTDIINRNKGN